jgi:hemolysin activation/secretion protein
MEMRLRALTLALSLAAASLADAWPLRWPGVEQGPRITVRRVTFDGVRSVPVADLERAVQPVIAQPLAFDDLTKVAAAAEKVYRGRGYFLAAADIPEQEFQDGTLKLVVTEGRIGRILIAGNKSYSTGFLKERLEPSMRRVPPRLEPIQRAVMLLNERAGLKLRTVFQAGAKPGETDVIVQCIDGPPIQVAFDYNDYGNRLVGSNRASVTADVANGIRPGDSLVVRAVEPFPTESKPFYQVDYEVPMGKHGNRFGGGYASAATVAGQELQFLDIRGGADVFDIHGSFPIARTARRRATFVPQLTFKSLENFLFGDRLVSKDDLRFVSFAYEESRDLDRARLDWVAVASRGLGDMFGGRENGDPLASRVGAGNSFTRANLTASYQRALPGDRYAIARVNGQWTGDPLVVAELFALGGPDSVRGFLQSEQLVDKGATAQMELRQSIFKKLARRDTGIQLVAFVDQGIGSLVNPQAGEARSYRFAGAGAGLRAQVGRHASVRVDVGRPLRPSRNADNDRVLPQVFLASRF